jgi:drug/metabolite transporter (DMT)-like permease
MQGGLVLTGVAMALLASIGWAGSSVILKYLTGKVDTVVINTLRLWTGTTVLVIFVVLSGKYTDVTTISSSALGYIVVSGIVAMAVGDTIYIKSLSLLDASIAFPIAQCSFVLFSGVAAIMLLDEPYTWATFVGAVLVMGGIYLIATGSDNKAKPINFQKVSLTGIIVALAASICWTTSAITLKIGSIGLDAFVVASIRILLASLVLTLLTMLRSKTITIKLNQYSSSTLLLIAAAGILTYGIAGVAFVLAIQLIGAGKSVLLTTTAPLFALPLAIIFLKERPAKATFLGVVICICGVYFVVI